MITCRCLLVAVLAACAVLPGNAQIAHINTKKPATPISSYRQYLERAGEAMGVLPTQPEAETTLSAHVPAAGPAASAMAPMSAPAGAHTSLAKLLLAQGMVGTGRYASCRLQVSNILKGSRLAVVEAAGPA